MTLKKKNHIPAAHKSGCNMLDLAKCVPEGANHPQLGIKKSRSN